MNKLITAAAAAAGLLLAKRILTPIKAHAWWGKTHEQITAFALERLEKDKKHRQAAFFKPYTAQLLKGCTDPDTDGDIDKASGTHSYSIADVKGKAFPKKNGYYRNRVGKYLKSARTMLEENYTSALSLYKSGRTRDAMYVFGRALHFLEDISAAPHTAEMKYAEKPDNVHHMFEKHAAESKKAFPPEDFDKRLVKTFAEDGFENAANKLGAAANKFAPQIASLDGSAFEKTEKAMIPLAAQNAAALMLRFYDDCIDGKGRYITDGAAVSIRSEETGEYLTRTEKGARLEKADHSLEQRFTVVMTELGTFSLKAADDSFLTADMKRFAKPDNGKAPDAVRAAGYGKNRFRLTAGEGFGSVVTRSRSALTTADMKPADSSQVWIIMS